MTNPAYQDYLKDVLGSPEESPKSPQPIPEITAIRFSAFNILMGEADWGFNMVLEITDVDGKTPEGVPLGILLGGRRITEKETDEWGMAEITLEHLPIPEPRNGTLSLQVRVKGQAITTNSPNFTIPETRAEKRARLQEEEQKRQEEARKKKEAEERIKAEKAQREEAERQARLQREKEEAERQAQLQLKREEAERQAQLQLKREEAERQARLQREKEEAEFQRQRRLQQEAEEQRRRAEAPPPPPKDPEPSNPRLKQMGFVVAIILAAFGFWAMFGSSKQDMVVQAPQPASSEQGATHNTTGQTWQDPVTGMNFVWIEGGSFRMGDLFGEGDTDEKSIRTVRVSSFWMATTEVTQGEWQKIMGNNPSNFINGDRYPVERVSWNDAQKFIQRMNQQGNGTFRLPSEAEWEYACREGGKQVKYGNGKNTPDGIDHNRDWTEGHKAVGISSNALGLYDMSGGVYEWVQDAYTSNYSDVSGTTDPVHGSGSYRVNRGGSWFNGPGDVRCADRGSNSPTLTLYNLGFRLVARKR
ncbi:MAG: SUMF1/EgtB/PvdO family nonheme iron enzyme [SAR324 cluster bacterium]|nr:SUMF1/EgtB/PvdO family nonheme iron enzyme [SAR324 cluster bacterium]